MNKFAFTITKDSMKDKTSWPEWLQKAWEKDWGQVGSFEPRHDGIASSHNYIVHTKFRGAVGYKLGDTITPASFV
ncbi:hypothetical protein [Celeribacter sp. SCSIO 80788]|uniref:hypothetical protein n=1 Tax=Celeribacter sp. SCSIO 80788 TaxID=3117013 RepID=UPI003DA6611C